MSALARPNPETGPPAPSDTRSSGAITVAAGTCGQRAADLADRQSRTALAAASRVLRIEGEAVLAAASDLDPALAEVVERIATTSGRVVVTGIGKSGHVARKVAATLASTGTPALYVHPGEASHGDLGMIDHADLVLALSNSGETSELAAIIAYSRRFAIPLVALTGRADSTLASAADLVLLLPQRPEACPLGLAPTTSTTVMLAIGDALAVALLERRGFGAQDFGLLHPGGQLGQRLVRVEQLMHQGDALPLRPPAAPLMEVVLEMTEKRLGCVGITGPDGTLEGIITDGDLRRHLRPEVFTAHAETIMTRAPKTIRAQALAMEAVAAMNAHAITVLFVVDGGRPVGVLHLHDCLRAGVA